MKHLLEFVKNDWNEIPQNLRYLIWVGVFLILNTWLLDHWGNYPTYLFWVWDIRQLGYSLGLTSIFICFVLIGFKQLFIFLTIAWFRTKYSIKHLGTSFELVWFKGKLYLFDNQSMTYHHVYPWQTAQDLQFVGRGYYVDADLNDYKAIKVGSRKYIRPNRYKEGGPINTSPKKD